MSQKERSHETQLERSPSLPKLKRRPMLPLHTICTLVLEEPRTPTANWYMPPETNIEEPTTGSTEMPPPQRESPLNTTTSLLSPATIRKLHLATTRKKPPGPQGRSPSAGKRFPCNATKSHVKIHACHEEVPSRGNKNLVWRFMCYSKAPRCCN